MNSILKCFQFAIHHKIYNEFFMKFNLLFIFIKFSILITKINSLCIKHLNSRLYSLKKSNKNHGLCDKKKITKLNSFALMAVNFQVR